MENQGITINETVVIKRYNNRKLYDTNESRYITLDGIQDLIKEGLLVKVIDNKTKEDITALTLLQVMFNSQRKKLINGDGVSVDNLTQAIKLS